MKTVLTLSLLIILAITVAVPSTLAQANDSQRSNVPSYDSDVFWQLASKQVVLSLASEYGHVRAQTLKNAIVFSTLYRDKVDLGAAVGPIASIAANDDSGEHRRLAMAALQAIGSFRAKQHLAELKGIPDNEYRLLVATVINEYYEKPNAL